MGAQYGSVAIRLRGPSSLRGRDPRVVVVFGVAILACDLGDRREGDSAAVLGSNGWLCCWAAIYSVGPSLVGDRFLVHER